MSMGRGKLIVIVASALLFAQLQCASACATPLCNNDVGNQENVPPCHRHRHSPAQDKTPGSCPQHIVVVAELSQHAPAIEMPVFSVANLAETVSTGALRDSRTSARDGSVPLPPGLHAISSTVLRI
jgi:hypothetical protein